MEFEHIKNHYIQGGITYRQLAAEYGVSLKKLAQVAKEQGWVALKKRPQGGTCLPPSPCAFCNHGEKVAQTADCLLDKMLSQIQQATRIESGALKQYTSALKDLRDIKAIKPPLEVREQVLKLEGLEQKNTQADRITHIALQVEGGEPSWGQ